MGMPHAGLSTEDIYDRSGYEGQHAEVVAIHLFTFPRTLHFSSFYSIFQPPPLYPTSASY